MKSENVLITLITLFTSYLDELSLEIAPTDFVKGEMTAFVECLEIIKEWELAERHGLNYIIDKKYKI